MLYLKCFSILYTAMWIKRVWLAVIRRFKSHFEFAWRGFIGFLLITKTLCKGLFTRGHKSIESLHSILRICLWKDNYQYELEHRWQLVSMVGGGKKTGPGSLPLEGLGLQSESRGPDRIWVTERTRGEHEGRGKTHTVWRWEWMRYVWG